MGKNEHDRINSPALFTGVFFMGPFWHMREANLVPASRGFGSPDRVAADEVAHLL